MWWDPAITSGCRPRQGKLDLVVWHHTAGEGNAAQIHRTLVGRGLSVHFTIDRDGTITQMADVDDVTYHAGGYNSRSVGIEIANRGVAPAHRKYPRDMYADTAHGKRISFLRFYDAQVDSAYRLFRHLSEVLGLYPEFPIDDRGVVDRSRLSRAFLATYSGHVGHMHLSGRKIDPSPHLMEDLMERAANEYK